MKNLISKIESRFSHLKTESKLTEVFFVDGIMYTVSDFSIDPEERDELETSLEAYRWQKIEDLVTQLYPGEEIEIGTVFSVDTEDPGEAEFLTRHLVEKQEGLDKAISFDYVPAQNGENCIVTLLKKRNVVIVPKAGEEDEDEDFVGSDDLGIF